MKILKIVGLVIVGIIALALITAAFAKKDFAVKREVIINKSKQEVFDYIKYLKNQDNYSVWAKMDPTMKKEFKGTDATVGATAFWDGEKMGKGSQTITGIKEGEQIDYSLHFIKPVEAENHASLATTAVDSTHTKVVWAYDGKMAYPMNLMMVFCDFDSMMGKDLQGGLDNLKGVLE